MQPAVDTPAPVILRTEAIALRIHPYSRTSHVVTWLSPAYGRVVTVIKGACRPKSAFLGQYDLAASCELLFYRRDHDGLHAIRECTALRRRDELRADWRRVTTASYLCDLVARVAQPGQDATNVHALLAATLDDLCVRAPDAAAVLRFELALLRHLGFLPQLALCPTCHAQPRSWLRFAPGSGRAVCSHAPAAAGEATVSLQREVVAYLQRLASNGAPNPDGAPPPSAEPMPRSIRRPRSGTPYPPSAPPGASDDAPQVSLGARRFLGIFMGFHLETPATPRRLAFELLETAPAGPGGAKGRSA